MNFVPEWAPNVHPMIIHFPIVLFILALVFDVLGLIWNRIRAWRPGALLLYGLGLAAVVVTYLTGEQAANSVSAPDHVIPAISAHADWAARTLWFWIVFVILRFLATWRAWDRVRWVLGVLIAVGVIGNLLVAATADRGAQLVYRYGVGVQQPETPGTEPEAQSIPQGEFSASETSVVWKIGRDALSILEKQLTWQPLPPGRVKAETALDEGKPELDIRLDDARALLLVPRPFGNLSLEAELNADGFRGEVLLVYHFSDTTRYDFLAVRPDALVLGRQEGDRVSKFSEKAAAASGWHRFKTVSSAGHYRGYLDNQLIVHGHGRDLPAGRAGLLLRGTGLVKIRELKITELMTGH